MAEQHYNDQDRDIWVVVFQNELELWLLEKQLAGLILHKNLYSYNIVINEVGFKQDECLDAVNAILRKHRCDFEINVFTFSQLIDGEEDCIKIAKQTANFGWINQQLCKLLIYKFTKHAESIILDAKNIPINDYCIDRIDLNLDVVCQADNSVDFMPFEKLICEKLQIEKPIIFIYLTPFYFERHILQKMHKDLDYSEFFFVSDTVYPSEFLLYESYKLKNSYPMKTSYRSRNSLRLLADQYDHFFEQFTQPDVFMSIHSKNLAIIGKEKATNAIEAIREKNLAVFNDDYFSILANHPNLG